MNTPSFSVVLVNYKTPEITRICLELLREHAQRLGFPVWVVDNDSADASTEYLRSLDWIRLIERKPGAGEPGFMNHGLALDLVLERADTDYLFLLHTDTFIYDPEILDIMLRECAKENVVAVGCLDQIYRGQFRIYWRIATRFLKHYARRLKLALGLKSRPPKSWMEQYIKSFCSLWNIRFIKQQGWTFAMDDMIPSYAIQDRLPATGRKIALIPARRMFRYLDHIEAGTVAASGSYGDQHRRTKKYQALLERYRKESQGAPD
jgi:GT2 family glycosyltransferase